jgi:hypothetical protein
LEKQEDVNKKEEKKWRQEKRNKGEERRITCTCYFGKDNKK